MTLRLKRFPKKVVLTKIVLVLYIAKLQNLNFFLMKYKKVNMTKGFHAYKGYVSIYNIEILNSFNPRLRLKDFESTIRGKQKDLLTELKGFEFVATVILEFQMMMKQSIAPFIRPQRLKQLLIRVILIMYLNRSILQNITCKRVVLDY